MRKTILRIAECAGFMLLGSVLCALVLVATGTAQQADNPKQIDTAAIQLQLADAPRPVPSATVQRIGNPGKRSVYYWIISVGTIGQSALAGPFELDQAPDVFDASDGAQLSWFPAAGATGYWVLRTLTSTPPAIGNCSCFVSGSVSSNLYIVDESESEYTGTIAPIDPKLYTVRMTNQSTGLGTNALQLSKPLPIASGGTGAGTAADALAALGAAPSASPTFTGTVTIPNLQVTGPCTGCGNAGAANIITSNATVVGGFNQVSSSTGSGVTLTFPKPNTMGGVTVTVQNASSYGDNIDFLHNGSGYSLGGIIPGQTLSYTSDGTSWNLVGSVGPSGGTSSIGGSALTAGQCASTTATVTGVRQAFPPMVAVTPVTYPGHPFYWRGYVSADDTITVEVCAAASGTPTASTYNYEIH